MAQRISPKDWLIANKRFSSYYKLTRHWKHWFFFSFIAVNLLAIPEITVTTVTPSSLPVLLLTVHSFLFKLLKVLTWFYWSNLKRQFFGKWFVEQNSGKILMIFITGWRTCCERVRFSKLLTFTRFRNIAMRFTIIRTFIRFCQFRMRFSKMLRFLIVIGWRWARRGAVTNLSFTDPEKLKSKQNGCSAGIWIAN